MTTDAAQRGLLEALAAQDRTPATGAGYAVGTGDLGGLRNRPRDAAAPSPPSRRT